MLEGSMSAESLVEVTNQSHAPILAPANRPPVAPEALSHRELRSGPFWQRLHAYANVSEAEFLDHQWQAKHSITNMPKLLAALEGLVSPEFVRDAENGFHHAPMPVRVSPYLLSLIDWSNPYEDPIRIQFIPLLSRRFPDHPKVDLDPLHERQDMPVPPAEAATPPKRRPCLKRFACDTRAIRALPWLRSSLAACAWMCSAICPALSRPCDSRSR